MSDNIFKEVPKLNYSEKARPVDFSAFKDVVESRRSVRVFTEESIPDHVVHECLDMALLAPNSSNLQPWEFLRIVDPKKKREIAKACFSQPAARTAQELIVCLARRDTWKNHCNNMLALFAEQERKGAIVPRSIKTYYKTLAPFVYGLGPLGILGAFKKVLYFFTGFFRVVPRQMTSRTDLKIWAVKTVALACENLMLAFRAAGFDSCPMEGFDSVRVGKILGLKGKYDVVMIIGAGRRADNGVYGPRLRFPRENFVREI